MGQYYYGVNTSKKEYVHPHHFDNGMKLMEHSWIGNNMMQQVCEMLEPNGRWHKDKIVWAGDYMDDGLFIPKEKQEQGLNLHQLVDLSDEFNEVEEVHKERKETVNLDGKPKLLINYDKNEYVDLSSLPNDDYGWNVHPLSLLCSSGNGRGGGDYRSTNGEKYIGYWANDRIGIDIQVPLNFTEIKPNFKE